MRELRFAVVGAGFWTRFQLAGWREAGGARCVAIANRTRAKAEALAREFGIPAVYDDADRMLRETKPDFVDVVTDPSTHARYVLLAAEHRIPVVCQKPMALSLDEAEGMVAACRAAGVPFLVHENWRWQAPIREVKRDLEAGRIGWPFRARLQFSSSFPVFENQPFLRELEEFILTDVGSHVLDVARFLFGEVESVACHVDRIHPDIRGEDVATALLRTASGVTVTVELSYASRLEHERFPETFIHVEGDGGSLVLGPGYELRVTRGGGTEARLAPPPRFAWADPAYELVHASIVPCCRDLLRALRGEGTAETTAEDNLKTVRLVFACYESARAGRTVPVSA